MIFFKNNLTYSYIFFNLCIHTICSLVSVNCLKKVIYAPSVIFDTTLSPVSRMNIKNIVKYPLSIAIFTIVFQHALWASSTYYPKYQKSFSEPWRWQQFEELNGRGCRCMTEDKQGNLWFGVNNGVLKYNGTQWKFYNLDNDSSETPTSVLCTTSNNQIYAGSSKGIYVYESDVWKKFEINLNYGDNLDFPNNRFPIIETSDNSIWVGTKQGVLRIQDGIMNLYREKEFFPNLHINNMYNDEIMDLPDFDIYSIFEESRDIIWIGLRDGRIFRCIFQNNPLKPSPVWQRIDIQQGYVRARFPLITKDKQGKIFIFSGEINKGVNIYHGNNWSQYKLLQQFNTKSEHTDIQTTRNGDILLTAGGRMFCYKNNKWYQYMKPDLPLPKTRWYMNVTNDDYLWIIGISSEVWRVDLSNKQWTTLQGLIYQDEGPAGDKWFLTHNGAIVKTDPLMNDWVRYDKHDGVIDYPVVIYTTKNGQAWCAGSHNQVAATACFDGTKWIKHLHPQLSWGIKQSSVFETLDGALWFGAYGGINTKRGFLGGLVRYTSPQKFNYYYFNDKFNLSSIYGIGQTADSTLWVGENALYSFDRHKTQFQKASEPANINNSFIDCISSSPDGDLWIGTRVCGVFWYNSKSKKWTQFTVNNNLSSNSIIYILAESNTNVWAATDKNICHFDGINWTSAVFSDYFKIRRTRFSIKKTSDGFYWINQIPNNWLDRANHNNSRFLDFSKKTFTILYKPDNIPPDTYITFTQDRIAQPGNVFISWKSNDPWKLTPDEHMQFSYRLDNDDWSPFTIEKNQIFLDIDDGQHTFQVRARDRDFNIDPSPAKIIFYIIPPTWKQPWFILLIVFFISTITFFIFRLIHRNKIIRDLSESKTRFFTNISHELLTPLTLISGPIRSLLDSIDKKNSWYDKINIISRNSDRLTKLVDQLLTFQKMESGRLVFNPIYSDIIKILGDVAHSFQLFASEKQIDYQINMTIQQLQMYYDRDKIEKILFNLLSNAFKYTQSQGKILFAVSENYNTNSVTIELSNKTKIQVNQWLMILVKDSGIGIPKDKTDKIFNRFYQVGDSSSNHTIGAGIGLSLTKELVELHYGNIEVNSDNNGTEFLVKIPVIKKLYDNDIFSIKSSHVLSKNNRTEINPEIDNKPQFNPQNNGKAKVLIVEDNLDMRTFVRLELTDYEVIEATDGIEGLKQALDTNPDIIISDVMMPRMDGLTFCHKIKSDEKTSHIPVIMLTARTLQEQKLEGLETGADDYLSKPFDCKELKLRVQNILESRRKFRQKFQNDILVNPKEIKINSVDKQFLNRAIEIIEKHMDNSDFDPQGFAREIGMSRTALYGKIKSLTGYSVRDFIVAIRLKRAAQLLKISGLTITEITFKVGFKNPSHFAKAFKKQFGMLPSEYNHQTSN